MKKRRISEAISLVLQAATLGDGGHIFTLDMGEPVKIVDLARDLIRLSGLQPDEVPIVFTGLRPGEKIEESLWEDSALVQSTAHPDILRVTEEPAMDYAQCSLLTASLRLAAQRADRRGLNDALANFIPTFTQAPVTPRSASIH